MPTCFTRLRLAARGLDTGPRSSVVRAATACAVVAALAVAPAALAGDTTAPKGADNELEVADGAFVIKGKVQKPQIVVVVRRKSLDRAIDLELKESFVQKIVEVTEEPPF